MQKSFSRLTLYLAVLGAFMSACQTPSPAIAVSRITFDLSETLFEAHKEGDSFRQMILTAIAGSPFFSVNKPRKEVEAGGLNLHVECREAEEGRARLSASLQPLSGQTRGPHAQASLLVASQRPGNAHLMTALRAAVPVLVAELIEALRLERAPTAEIIGYLQSKETSRRQQAARMLGARPEPAAARALLAAVAVEKEPACQLMLVGSLVQHHEQDAVSPIIDLMQRRHPYFVAQLCYALGELGGRLAETYLVNLAAGHLDEEVRQSARAALGDLIARRQNS